MINPTEIDKERGAQYGDFRDMANVAQTLKSLARNRDMSPVQVEAVELICTKLARLALGNPNNIDSWLDIAGYANLVVRDLNRPSVIGTRDGAGQGQIAPGSWNLQQKQPGHG